MAARRHHYHVYVVELSDQVWNSARFRRANPDYRLRMPFVYVGMTGVPRRGAAMATVTGGSCRRC